MRGFTLSSIISNLCLALAFLVATTQGPGLRAQVLYGTIVGSVQDPAGAVVPGASVSITAQRTGQVRETGSDDTGRYIFVNVLPGTYTLTASAPGFRTYRETDVFVTVNTVTRVPVSLELGEVTETIDVEAAATVLQTDQSDVHAELTSKPIVDLPLSNYRNFQTLINLVPGATPARFQNAITDTPDRALTTHVNGTVRNNNRTRVDGAVNIFPYLVHHTLYVPPVESIETVNISTNNFDAEQGLTTGAAITVITKSGTNEYHGSAFALFTGNKLKAKNFFFTDVGKPHSNFNIDGGTFGGPIAKNKLFFFGSWEGTRQRQGFSRLATVATAAQREGDFSSFGTTIFDPLTGNEDGTGRQPFPGNKIPSNRQSAITRKMQALVPLPNRPGTSSNFANSGTSSLNRDNFDVKVNWNPSSNYTMFGKYTLVDAQVECAPVLGEAGGRGLCNGGIGLSDTLVNAAAVGSTWIITPNFLIDGTVGYGRMGQNVKGPDFGENFGLDVLGIPGTNGPDIRQSGKPIFAISGFERLGNPNNWSPLFRNDESYTGSVNASWTRGAHNIRFGFDLLRLHINHWQPEAGGAGPRGRFNFRGGVTGLSGGSSPNRFNAYASFLLGLPQSVGKSLQFFSPMSTREWQLGWYVRDRWQLSPKLTVTLGLRYEYYPLLTRAAGGIERYDPETNKVLIGRRGGVPDGAGTTVSKRLFAPRVGFAYRLGSKTVIRSGYGITYDADAIGRLIRSPFPVVIAQDFLGRNSFQPFNTIEEGIPEFTGPDISSGVVDIPGTAQTNFLPQGRFHRGYVQSWNFIIDRELPLDFVASVGYVGTRTIRQLADVDLNAAPPGGGTAGRPFAQRFGRTVETNLLDGFLTGQYHSLQATVNRRFTNGLFVKGAYTFSQTINENDENGADDGSTTLFFNYPSERKRNRGLAGFDRTHVLQLAAIYELPFGPGKRFAGGRNALSYVVRDWQINALFSAYSGTPFTVEADDASLNAPGNGQTADQVKKRVRKFGGKGLGHPYFDPTAFAPVTETRFGNTGRNILRGPGVVNLDLGVFRDFPITERFRLQFRAESFNVSNTPHFNNPNANVSEDDFATITSAKQDERSFRFGLRLFF